MKKFEDKVAIVTGSTSGIGRQAAYQLAENGAKVVITGRNEDRAKEAVDHIIAAGGEALAISSSKTPIGRSGSLPLPSKRQCFPNAPAIGSRKRRVEPLSPQSRVQSCPSACPMPCPFACPILSTGQASRFNTSDCKNGVVKT